MKGPLCSVCNTQTSLERGDILLIGKRISDLEIDEVMDAELNVSDIFLNEAGYQTAIKVCLYCHEADVAYRRGPTQPHQVIRTGPSESCNFLETYPNLKAAEEAFDSMVESFTKPDLLDSTFTILNSMSEVVRQHYIDNGHPDAALYDKIYGKFCIDECSHCEYFDEEADALACYLEHKEEMDKGVKNSHRVSMYGRGRRGKLMHEQMSNMFIDAFDAKSKIWQSQIICYGPANRVVSEGDIYTRTTKREKQAVDWFADLVRIGRFLDQKGQVCKQVRIVMTRVATGEVLHDVLCEMEKDTDKEV